jgi:hypothetical protein
LISCSQKELTRSFFGKPTFTEKYSNIPSRFGKKLMHPQEVDSITPNGETIRFTRSMNNFKELKVSSFDMILPEKIEIKSREPLEKIFGYGPIREKFKTHFLSIFLSTLKKDYDLFYINVMDFDDIEMTNKVPQNFTLEGDNIVRDYFPKNGEIKGLKTDYAIIFTHLYFGKFEDYTSNSFFSPQGIPLTITQLSDKGLIFGGTYYIWDNKNQEIISFLSRGSLKGTFFLSKDDLDDLIRRFASIFLDATVFNRETVKVIPGRVNKVKANID